jgi:hypothetical protein
MKKVLDNIDEETGKKYSAYNSIYSVDIESRIKNIFWGLFFVLILILLSQHSFKNKDLKKLTVSFLVRLLNGG